LPDVFLTSLKDANKQAVMTPSVLERVLNLSLPPNRQVTTLHADWSALPAGYQESIELAFSKGARLHLAFDGNTIDKNPNFGKNIPIVGCLSALEPSVQHPFGDWGSEFELFVPIAAPRFPRESLLHTVRRMATRIQAVTLAPGWIDRHSGVTVNLCDDGPTWAESLGALVLQFSELGIPLRIACGLPLCIFNDSQLARLASCRLVWPIGSCPMPLCIDPEGRIRPCQSLPPVPELEIENLPSFRVSRKFVRDRYAAYGGICMKAEGFSCRSLRLACHSGCVGLEMNEWSGRLT
jgi:hypothetical protein